MKIDASNLLLYYKDWPSSVAVNGMLVELRNVVAFDVSEGWVEMTARDQHGHVIADDGELRIHRLVGTVVVGAELRDDRPEA